MGRHEIPTKLEVEDKVVFGMTARQLLCLGIGIALGYVLYQRTGQILWHHMGQIPLAIAVRIVVGLLPLGSALAFAFIRPAGRTLETWIVVLVHYARIPKRCVWRPVRITGHDRLDETLCLDERAPDSTRPLPLSDLTAFQPMPPAYREIMQGE
jgi:hypothetical protein